MYYGPYSEHAYIDASVLTTKDMSCNIQDIFICQSAD